MNINLIQLLNPYTNPTVNDLPSKKVIYPNPRSEDICSYLESHLIPKLNHQNSIVDAYFESIMGYPKPSNPDKIENWVLNFLNLAEGHEDNQIGEIQPSKVIELVGVNNALALYMRGYQVAHEQAINQNGDSEFSRKNSRVLELMASNLQTLILEHLDSYKLLEIEKIHFKKEDVSPILIDKKNNNKLIKAITLCALGLLMIDFNELSSLFKSIHKSKVEVQGTHMGDWYIHGLREGRKDLSLDVYQQELLKARSKTLQEVIKQTGQLPEDRVGEGGILNSDPNFKSYGLNLDNFYEFALKDIKDNRTIPAHWSHEAEQQMFLDKILTKVLLVPTNRSLSQPYKIAELYKNSLFSYYHARVANDPNFLSSISRKSIGTKNYRELVLTAIDNSEDGYALLRADKASFEDVEIMSKAVEKNGYLAALLHVKLFNSKDIRDKAINSTPFSLRFFPEFPKKELGKICTSIYMSPKPLAKRLYIAQEEEPDIHRLKNLLLNNSPLTESDYQYAKQQFIRLVNSDIAWLRNEKPYMLEKTLRRFTGQ